MAKDIKFLIGGDSRGAEAALKNLQRTGHDVTSALEREFDQLGIKSSQAFENKRKAATIAYDRIKSSGLATQEELARAEKAFADRMVAIDTEQFGKRESLLQKFKANWLGVTAAIGAGVAAIIKGWNEAEAAAKGLQQRAAFAQLAASKGGNADAIIAELKRVSAETISTQQLVEKAGTAMLLGIEQKYLPKLMEISRASSRITGQTITQAFDDLSLAVARQSKMILDNLGIMVNVEKANKDYAASLGKTSEQLNDAERRQAFLNATLAAGQVIIDGVAVSTVTQSEKMQQLAATTQEAREVVGRLVLALGVGLYAAFRFVTGHIHLFVGSVTWAASKIAELASKVPVVGKVFRQFAEDLRFISKAALETAGENYKAAGDAFGSSWNVIAGDVGPVNEKLAGLQQKLAAQRAQDEARAAAEAARKDKARLDQFRQTAAEIINIEKKRIKDQEDLEKAHLDKLKASYAATISELNKLIDTQVELRKLMDARNKEDVSRTSGLPAQDDVNAYLSQQDQLLEAEKKLDAQWADPAAKARGYNALIDQAKSYMEKIKASGTEIISSYEAEARYAEFKERAQEKINELLDSEIQKKEDAAVSEAEQMEAAERRMKSYQARVEELDRILNALPKVVEIDVKLNIHGMSSLASVTSATGYRNYGDYYTAGGKTYWSDGSLADEGTGYVGNFATGTSYVPRTGLYQLHRGETVSTRGETAAAGRGVQITFAPSITMQGGTREQASQSIRELARLLTPELRRLGERYA